MKSIIKVMLIMLLISIIGLVGVGCVGDKDSADKGDGDNIGGGDVDKDKDPPYVAQGSFYGMQMAYDAGILTVEDLQNIAYYYNGKSDIDGFVPKPKVPAELSDTVKNVIKREYRDTLNVPPSLIETHPDGVTLINYYGIYNDAIAVMIEDSYMPKDIEVLDYIVAGVTFYDYYYNLCVWKIIESSN